MINALIKLFANNGENRAALLKAENVLKAARHGNSIVELDEWIKLSLNAKNWQITNIAVKVIGILKKREHIESLLLLVTHNEKAPFIRRNAAISLLQIGCSDRFVLDALFKAVDDPYWEVRSAAGKAIASLGSPNQSHEELLIKKIFKRKHLYCNSLPIWRPNRIYIEKNFEVRASLTEALGTVALSEQAIIKLGILLNDDSWKVRYAALLGMISIMKRQLNNKDLILKYVRDMDLTCSDFKPTFPLRVAWNRFVDETRTDHFNSDILKG